MNQAEAMERAAQALDTAETAEKMLNPKDAERHVDRARAWMQLARQYGEMEKATQPW